MTPPGLRDLGGQLHWHASRILHEQPAEVIREAIARREERRLLDQVRDGRDVCWIEGDAEAEPLVTVRIATYNRGQLVVDRAIASAIRQTYERLEILVVGDHCDEPTQRAVAGVQDPRLRFINLPHRGLYPADAMKRWMVAGATPMNAGLFLAMGAWLAPCDDDDELTDDHVEVLLREAKARRLELVYSRTEMEKSPGAWVEVGRPPLRHGHISHGSVLYSMGLRFMKHSETSWRRHEPADWNLWRRMRRIGVHIGFVDRVTYRHFLEAHQRTAS